MGDPLAPMDVSEAVTAIGAVVGYVGLIGAAVLLVQVGVRVYRWIRRAM